MHLLSRYPLTSKSSLVVILGATAASEMDQNRSWSSIKNRNSWQLSQVWQWASSLRSFRLPPGAEESSWQPRKTWESSWRTSKLNRSWGKWSSWSRCQMEPTHRLSLQVEHHHQLYMTDMQKAEARKRSWPQSNRNQHSRKKMVVWTTKTHMSRQAQARRSSTNQKSNRSLAWWQQRRTMKTSYWRGSSRSVTFLDRFPNESKTSRKLSRLCRKPMRTWKRSSSVCRSTRPERS